MSKTFNLTEGQLDFISFMNREVSSHEYLKTRFESLLSTLAKEKEKFAKQGSSIRLKHSPHTMIKFLALFSRDDRFKWYTHKWDISTPFDIQEMISRQTIYKGILSDMAYPKESGPMVNEKTFNQVWNFINFSNPASKTYVWKNTKFENIRYGWHSIVNLSRENSGIPVENLIVSDGHQFKDYIRMFKAVIEFRTDLNDENRFSELVWNGIMSGLPKDFDIEFDSKFDEIGYDLNVYCDVIGLLSALNTICNWIVRHKARSSEVKIDLSSEDEYYILEIFHLGSYFSNIEKLQNSSGDLEELRERLFSICDFSLEGDYIKEGKRNGSLIVNALDESTEKVDRLLSCCSVQESHTEIGGVKYKLKIYKR
ncbi:MAG: hypothetical protein HDS24_04110 [Bacteroides sp.]|nr:hypothetical protein [Bacteroidales bacterium]MBD5291243.1 hypothetical protein [Bacteroides sp.]